MEERRGEWRKGGEGEQSGNMMKFGRKKMGGKSGGNGTERRK